MLIIIFHVVGTAENKNPAHTQNEDVLSPLPVTACTSQDFSPKGSRTRREIMCVRAAVNIMFFAIGYFCTERTETPPTPLFMCG